MRKILVKKNNLGQRLDKFLVQEVFFNEEITRGEIIRQIKTGHILVNGKKIKPSYLLKENDEVKITIPKKNAGLTANKNVGFEIIFQNENFIVIDKPAGLQVHPSAKNETDTLVNGLLVKFPKIKNVGDEPENRPGIVHRLDKDTSGILLIAKNQKTFLYLKNKFKNREIEKTYLAIVYGNLKNKKGTIDASLARSLNYKKQTIAQDKTKTKIRSAVTNYEVLQEMKGYSLVEVKPKTGRMHQIRVHFASIGHPILGDKLYWPKKIKSPFEISRHLLHAQKLEFEINEENFNFETPMPDDFILFLTKNK